LLDEDALFGLKTLTKRRAAWLILVRGPVLVGD